MKRRIVNLLCAVAITAGTYACTAPVLAASAAEQAAPLDISTQGLWRNVFDIQSGAVNGTPAPRKFRLVELDTALLLSRLTGIPQESASTKAIEGGAAAATELAIPMPDGTVARFRVFETAVMSPELAAKFPQTKTWAGQGIDDPTASIFLDYGSLGFHAMVLSTKTGRVFIDPNAVGETKRYKSYFAKDHIPTEVDQLQEAPPLGPKELTDKVKSSITGNLQSYSTLSQLRTYRLAVAATEDYTDYFGGTVQNGLDAIVAAVNRVSGIYKTEVGIAFQLIGDNDNIIFTNGNPGPYSGNIDENANLVLNQKTLDNKIGTAKYDIGHVFSTIGSGRAYLGSVCDATDKAKGGTGKTTPNGDAFWVDYVSHEIGHQLGAQHTFNSVAGGGCKASTFVADTAYEPGSGSTIMSYAGICTDDLQPHSDPYFHSSSFDEIENYIQNDTGSTCGTVTANGNHIPAPSTGTGGFTIPANTPFTLTGSGNDGDGNTLTYSWEEYDRGTGAIGFSPISAPFFRSWPATTSPVRSFPRLADLLHGRSTLGENLPTISTTLHFRLTARDNRADGGGVAYAPYSFDVKDTGTSFSVTSPTGVANWPASSPQQVSWNVAGTAAAPISCSAVDISLSTDQGATFTVMLAKDAPNNGAANVIAPSNSVVDARIKVACSSHVAAGSAVQFFALSPAFQIAVNIQNPVNDGFESGSGWTSTNTFNNPGYTKGKWSIIDAATSSRPAVVAHGGSKIAKFNSANTFTDESARYVLDAAATPIPAQVGQVQLGYWFYHSTKYGSAYSDTVQVQISTDDGTHWSNVGPEIQRVNGTDAWEYITVDLAAYAGQSIKLAFLGVSKGSTYNLYLDDVVLTIKTPTAVTAPGMPTMGTATGGNAQGTVSFTAPSNSGGAVIDAYRVTCSNPAVITQTGTASPITIAGLTNGTTYTCTVAAHNSQGWGTESPASNSFVPTDPFASAATAPSAPTISSATPGNAQTDLAIDAPSFSGTAAGGAAASITGYKVTCNPGAINVSSASSSVSVTGLVNGTTYTCSATATNSAGMTSAPSAAVTVTPSTVPSAPTAVAGTAGNAFATLSFGAPTSNGGLPVLQYRATCGGLTAVGSDSPLTVSGLVNGTAYACTLAARNVNGWGPESSLVMVTPAAPLVATAPTAPGIAKVAPSNGQATLTITAPASAGTGNGGAASSISSYAVRCSPNGSASNTTSPVTVTSLTNGTAYTCTATATNAAGMTSVASTASESFVPSTVPTAPTGVVAMGGDKSAAINFNPPASNGGASVLGYRVTCSDKTQVGATSPLTVAGLANGVSVTCTVAAQNANGWSAESAGVVVTPAVKTVSGTASTGSGTITATLSGGADGCGFASYQFKQVSATSVSTAGLTAGTVFPHGLFAFTTTARCTGEVHYELEYPDTLPATTAYWKFGPTGDNPAAHWYQLPARIVGKTAIFDITDGGLGDDDLNANGTVVDDGGPGYVPSTVGSATAVPTLAEWVLWAFSGLLGSLGLLLVGRRRAPV